jgi:hypothetical protein
MTDTLIIVFLNGSTIGSEITVGDPTAYTSPNVAYAFTPANNDLIPEHYSNTGLTYAYNEVDPSQFMSAVLADSTLTALIPLLQSWINLVPSYSANPPLAISLWSYLVATYGPSGSNQMTSVQITTIEGYADAANMPLVSP